MIPLETRDLHVEAGLDAVLDAMDDAVLVVSRGGSIMRTNAATERAFGINGSRLVALGSDGSPLPDAEQPVARAARGETFRMEFEGDTPDGAHRWFEAVGRPLHAEAADAAVLVVRDVSERTLRVLQERFIAMAGHELRTPLTAVRGYLEVLRRRLALGPGDERLDLLEETTGQVERLVALVEELLDLSRLRPDRLAVEARRVDIVALAETASATATVLGDGRRIELTAPDERIHVAVDARRLEQAVLNLLMNAIRHAPGDRPVRLVVGSTRDTVEIGISDDGPGIASERLRDIFEPFTSDPAGTPGDGLGLGLFIARRIVEAHDGDIRVESTVGRGSTFTISLPMRRSIRHGERATA